MIIGWVQDCNEASPDVVERFKTLNVDAARSTPEAFTERIRRERARWEPVVKASGLKMEE